MGLFDFLKRRKTGVEPKGPAAEDGDDIEPVAIAIVREGMSPPSDEDMKTLLAAEAPDCLELPRTGLAQPRWWRQDDWVAAGMRQIARALARTHGNDPNDAEWDLVRDERGARAAIVYLLPKQGE